MIGSTLLSTFPEIDRATSAANSVCSGVLTVTGYPGTQFISTFAPRAAAVPSAIARMRVSANDRNYASSVRTVPSMRTSWAITSLAALSVLNVPTVKTTRFIGSMLHDTTVWIDSKI